MIRKVIWCLPYVNVYSFSSNISILRSAVFSQMNSRYRNNSCLLYLINYYSNMCSEEMYERIELEKCICDMHKRFELDVNAKEIL